MKIRTAEDLERVLTEDVAWRRKELITLKLMHDGARNHQQEMLRRAGVALLYAHWEGFTKSAGTTYVELVARQGLRYTELRANFVAMGAKSLLQQFASTSRGLILCQVSDFFVNQLGARASISWNGAVQTKSNLSAEVARDIVSVLGLDYRPFEVHEKTVIDRLRDLRNNIAHGRHLAIEASEYHTLHDATLGLLDELNNQICLAAHARSYRR